MAGKEQVPNAGKHILIIEDHIPTAELLCEILQEEGYDAQWAGNAEAALDIISRCDSSGSDPANRCPDLILLDLTMQGLSPLEMAHRLPQVSQVIPPLIVLSARPSQEVEAAARSINAAGLVRKPFEMDTLLDTVEKALASVTV